MADQEQSDEDREAQRQAIYRLKAANFYEPKIDNPNNIPLYDEAAPEPSSAPAPYQKLKDLINSAADKMHNPITPHLPEATEGQKSVEDVISSKSRKRLEDEQTERNK